MALITARGWVKLIEHLEAVVIPIVHEFYANAVEQDHNVFVCRKLVSFDNSKINAFYGLPNIDNDEYHALLE